MEIMGMFYSEEELVVTATRHPKPLSQVAENITVITAQEIREMNAHTVAEVINRVPGIFVSFNRDFGAPSLFYIQGSEHRHVLVQLDGVPWTLMAEGAAITNTIPVGIIERIEIIKGPASSAWGSSLGGVINIITKDVGYTKRPVGNIRASFGERDTRDLRLEVQGKAGELGYYLFAGRQHSKGLKASRYFETDLFYAKGSLPIGEKITLGFSAGYTRPNNSIGDFPPQDVHFKSRFRTFFTTANITAALSRNLSFYASMHVFKQKVIQGTYMLGSTNSARKGSLFFKQSVDEKTVGGTAQLVWKPGRHTAVLGFDFDRGDLDQAIYAGDSLQLQGIPGSTKTHPDEERWAVFFNDTIVFGRWSVTPGLRYDHNSRYGSFVSPSLGVTRRLGDTSLLRLSVSRGFTAPALATTSGGGLLTASNPSLNPEEVWTYQAGIETKALGYVFLKAAVYVHEVDELFEKVRYQEGFLAGSFNQRFENVGDTSRQGFELEAETVRFHNFTFGAGFAYTHYSDPDEAGSRDRYMSTVFIKYDDRQSFTAQLFGHYVWFDVNARNNASYDDFIWSFDCAKTLHTVGPTSTELFFTAHNLFNGGQYATESNENPQRWIEAGIRFSF